MGDLVDLTGDEVDTEKSLIEEYERFLNESAVKGNADPLEWWGKHLDGYKKRAPIAKFFLCIPGTSVPSERVFSDTGNIVTKKRASLDPDTVNQLVFLRLVLTSTKSTISLGQGSDSVQPASEKGQVQSVNFPEADVKPEPVSPGNRNSLPPLPSLEPNDK